MKVSIVIVSFNTKDYTRKCLESIRKFVDLKSTEVIVVDNGSSDGSLEMLEEFEKARPRKKQTARPGLNKLALRLIENKENVGFARANNQGIKLALEHGADYVFLLNSDTEVKEKGTIKKLVEVSRKLKNVGAVAPKLILSDGSVQESVRDLPTVWGAVREYWLGVKSSKFKVQSSKLRSLRRIDMKTDVGGDKFGNYVPERINTPFPALGGAPSLEGIVSVQAAVMAAMLVPRSTIEKIGLLDEGYFMYFEDFDYCRRIQRAGLKIYYVPDAEIIHHHGKSGEKLAVSGEQWRRLIPGSKRYHGWLKHYLIQFVLWSGQKIRNL